MLDRRDAEFQEKSAARKLSFDDAWRSGVLGDSAYMVSLRGIGISASDAFLELRLLHLIKHQTFRHPRAAWC